MNIKLLHDRILVKPDPVKELTDSGIIIPKERPLSGKVLAVGPGTKDETMTVSIGDRVSYGKYAGIDMTIDDEEVVFLHESDIIAILNETIVH